MPKLIVFDWIDTLFKRDTALFPGSKLVLSECKNKGFKLALVTKAGGDSPEVRWKQIRESGVESFFDKIFVGLDKDEVNYSEIITSLNVSPSETWVVGDQVCKDIRIGNNLGCKTVWIRSGGRHNDRLPDKNVEEPTYTINRIDEFLDLI